MPKLEKIVRVGFWYSPQEPKLPKPKERVKGWKGRKAFLKALRTLEGKSHKRHFKGWSTCRICHCPNGSVEYTTSDSKAHVVYEWPQGLAHYVDKHGVKPPADFIAFVLSTPSVAPVKPLSKIVSKRPVAAATLQFNEPVMPPPPPPPPIPVYEGLIKEAILTLRAQLIAHRHSGKFIELSSEKASLILKALEARPPR